MRALTSKKICVSVRWVTLWVCPLPPNVKICVSIRWVTLWVRPPPLCENMCVRSLGYIVGASPPLGKYVCPFVGLHCGRVPPVKIRDLFIDEAHTALGIFPVFFPCIAYSALRHFLVVRLLVLLAFSLAYARLKS